MKPSSLFSHSGLKCWTEWEHECFFLPLSSSSSWRLSPSKDKGAFAIHLKSEEETMLSYGSWGPQIYLIYFYCLNEEINVTEMSHHLMGVEAFSAQISDSKPLPLYCDMFSAPFTNILLIDQKGSWSLLLFVLILCLINSPCSGNLLPCKSMAPWYLVIWINSWTNQASVYSSVLKETVFDSYCTLWLGIS